MPVSSLLLQVIAHFQLQRGSSGHCTGKWWQRCTVCSRAAHGVPSTCAALLLKSSDTSLLYISFLPSFPVAFLNRLRMLGAESKKGGKRATFRSCSVLLGAALQSTQFFEEKLLYGELGVVFKDALDRCCCFFKCQSPKRFKNAAKLAWTFIIASSPFKLCKKKRKKVNLPSSCFICKNQTVLDVNARLKPVL